MGWTHLDGLDPFGWVGLMMVDVLKAQVLKGMENVYLHFPSKPPHKKRYQ